MGETTLPLLVFGAVAGVLAGLFGAGGGIVLVPALLLLFQRHGISADVVTHLAIGTSLASITATGFASGWTHRRQGHFDKAAVLALIPFVVLGTQTGALIAGATHGPLLQRLFGLFELGVGVQMALAAQPPTQGTRFPRLLYGIGGVVIGAASALFGIGGGTLTVPLLVYFFGRPLKIAIGCASIVGVVSALFGTAGFIWRGWQHPGLPQDAVGYVLPGTALTIAVASVPMAFIGAHLAHRVNTALLKQLFGTLLMVVGVRLIATA